MVYPPALLLALAAAAVPASAFWRMECRGVTGYYRMDPLVSPGKPSAHLHAILGSGGFSETSDYADLRASNCTSCLVTQDKSAYWHPALYFLDTTTNQYELVEQVGGTLAYYFLNTGSQDKNITAFPEGFRMIAGDNSRRTYTVGDVGMADPGQSEWAAQNQTGQADLAQRALGFNCLDYKATPEKSLLRHFLPDKTYLDAHCPDGIRFELMFPSCWNGVDLDSPNHKDHVAYPDLVMTGDCPADFPVRLPSLFYETIWQTPSYTGRSGQFVISNGDMQGYAYHGDFMMGWDRAFLQEAVDTCTSLSGEIGDCPLFDIQSLDDANRCKVAEPADLADEQASGPLATLPGNLTPFGDLMDVTVVSYDAALASSQPLATSGLPAGYGTGGAGAVTAVAAALAPSVVAAPSSTAASPTAASPTAASPTASSPTASSPTASSPTAAPSAEDNAHIVSTQYITADDMVTEILWEQETVYVTECSDVTETVLARTADALPETPAARRRFAHDHMRHHARHQG